MQDHSAVFIHRVQPPPPGPLVAVKDNVDVAGMVTTAGGMHLPRVPAGADATVVAAARRAGYSVVGKTNMHEYAFGVTSVNPHFGAVGNPVDPSRSAGGSSSGSAVAVALGLCEWAIGTDTAGSIRIPAALCGVVGLKPTTGSIDMTGIVPLATSLDTVGPLARDVATVARAWRIMAGSATPTSEPQPEDAKPRLAVPEGWDDDLDEPTAAAWARVSADLPRIPLPPRDELTDPYQPILFAEALTVHRRWWAERPEAYGADVQHFLRLGEQVLAVDYLEALQQRARLRRRVEQALAGFDALLLPTTQVVAPPLRSEQETTALLELTRPLSLTGHPAISIPAPVASGALPVGVQLVGRVGEDAALLATAARVEAGWRQHPV